jgi:hypothetical protein
VAESSQQGLESIQEEAAAYVLDTLPPADRQRFQQRLSSGCPLCNTEVRIQEAVLAAIAIAAPAVPSPALRGRLMAQLAPTTGGQDGGSGLVSIRAGEGTWQPVAPGIDRKMLYVDRAADAITYLLRMTPGSVLPRHEHGGVEQCLIVSGSLSVGAETFGPGDFQWLEAHSVHAPIHSGEGCTVLIVASHASQTRLLA